MTRGRERQPAGTGAPPNPPKPPPPKPPARVNVHAPVASVGWMVRAVAWTAPLAFLGPTARTQLSTVRSAAVAGDDSVTDRVVGTVADCVAPAAVLVTVTVVPDT